MFGMVPRSKNLYDFVDDNPQIVVLDVGFVNVGGTYSTHPPAQCFVSLFLLTISSVEPFCVLPLL